MRRARRRAELDGNAKRVGAGSPKSVLRPNKTEKIVASRGRSGPASRDGLLETGVFVFEPVRLLYAAAPRITRSVFNPAARYDRNDVARPCNECFNRDEGRVSSGNRRWNEKKGRSSNGCRGNGPSRTEPSKLSSFLSLCFFPARLKLEFRRTRWQ